MISEEFVWQNICPTVERLIEATLAEDNATAQKLFHPRGEAAALFDLFGLPVFDILLKTVLGRSSLAVTRAIETDETERGRAVHIEFVWPDPDVHDNSYTAADLVAVKMLPYRKEWRVFAVN